MSVKSRDGAQIGTQTYDGRVDTSLVEQPTERRIGPHLPLGAGLLKAAARADEIGATAVQIWTDNPTAWRRRQEQPRALEEFRLRLRAAGVKSIAVHAPYLINLCGANDDFWHKSIATMANELRVGQLYGADGVVMHIGSHRGLGRDEGIRRLIDGLRAVLDETSSAPDGSAAAPMPRLVLENAAGTGDGIGAPLEDLGDILDAAAAGGLDTDRLGVCLDTAHLWGAGYDLSNERGVDGLVKRLDELIGRDKVVMLHLNDSRTTVGSHLDRHEHIAAGQIGVNGMRELLSHPWLATLPTFLETPGMDSGYDQVNLDRARMLIDGVTPPPLPPEAFEVRGSKTRTAPPATS
jgi:deoxyribonuclease-4